VKVADSPYMTSYYEMIGFVDCTAHMPEEMPENPGMNNGDPGNSETPNPGDIDAPEFPFDWSTFDWSSFDPFDMSTWPFDPYTNPSSWPFDPFDSSTWPGFNEGGSAETPPSEHYLPAGW